MLNRILLGFLLFSLIVSGKCKKDSEDCHYNVKVLNNSTMPVYIIWQLNYPDTSINDPNPLLQGEYYRVNPGRNDFSLFHNDCFEDVYKYRIPSDTMMFFVFDAHLLEQTSWETVKSNYMVLNRFDYSLADLRNRNFTITYP